MPSLSARCAKASLCPSTDSTRGRSAGDAGAAAPRSADRPAAESGVGVSLAAAGCDGCSLAAILPYAGQAAAEVSIPSRKVRTSQGKVVGNADPGKPAGKCHRKDTA